MRRSRSRWPGLILLAVVAAAVGTALGWPSDPQTRPVGSTGPRPSTRPADVDDEGRSAAVQRAPVESNTPSGAAEPADREAPRPSGMGAPDGTGRSAPGVRGRVVDRGGLPVADCTVQLFPARLDGWLLGDPLDSRGPAAAVTAHTDAEGRFHCLLERPRTSSSPPVHALLLDHPQFPPQIPATDLRLTQGTLDLGDLELQSAVGLEVTVRSSVDGRPLAGAVVGARPVLLDPLLATAGERLTRAAVADRDGVTRLYGLASGPLRLRVEASGHATTIRDLPPTAAGRPGRLQVLLEPGLVLAGQLVAAESGAPLAAARLRLTTEGDTAVRLQGRSDARGRFRLDGLPAAGGCTLLVLAPGRPPHQVAPLQLPPAGPLRIAVPPGLRVAGRVVEGPDARPLPGCTVRLEYPDGRPLAGERLARPLARTDSSGHFRFIGLAPGRIRVRITSDAHMEFRTEPTELTSDTPEHWLGEVVLTPGCRLRGRILGADGAPLPGAEVDLLHADSEGGPGRRLLARAIRQDRLAAPTQTDAAGRFEMASALPPAARFRLRARAGGHATTLSAELVAPGDTTADALECGSLRLEPALAVTGVVLDFHGEPVAGATLEAEPRDPGPLGRAAATARTDLQGRFRISALARGSYRFRALAPRDVHSVSAPPSQSREFHLDPSRNPAVLDFRLPAPPDAGRRFR